MKVAIVHDYIKEYGGAERVVETFLEIWPEADVYTAVYAPGYLGPHRDRVEKWNIRTSFLQNIPFKEKLLSPFRFIGPWIFKSFDLSNYDLIIVSAAGTYTSPNFVNKGKKSLHICYCHTPPRYLYGYPTAAPWKGVWWRRFLLGVGQVPMHFLKMADFNAAQKPDFFIANSKEVASRIKKFYRRKAEVIYPPVDIPEEKIIKNKEKSDSYYLAGGRLARPKRVDLAVRACSELKVPLKVFGRVFAGYGEELKEIAGESIEFLGEVSDEQKWQLMAGAKAYIFPSDLEDFGITPVEAMAVGTPVIAYRSGGVMESVVEGKTGVFFDKLRVEEVKEAIERFGKMNLDSSDCIDRAREFSKDRFKDRMKEFVASKL